MRVISLLAMCALCLAVDVPSWVTVGILKTETKSYYRVDGSIKYVDKRRGRAGEYGPFQMTKAAFLDIRKKGEQFWMLETDTTFAEECADRYLVWLHTNFNPSKDWSLTVQMYNAGPHNKSPAYLALVRKNGLQ